MEPTPSHHLTTDAQIQSLLEIESSSPTLCLLMKFKEDLHALPPLYSGGTIAAAAEY